jgi:hypothetical protein
MHLGGKLALAKRQNPVVRLDLGTLTETVTHPHGQPRQRRSPASDPDPRERRSPGNRAFGYQGYKMNR